MTALLAAPEGRMARHLVSSLVFLLLHGLAWLAATAEPAWLGPQFALIGLNLVVALLLAARCRPLFLALVYYGTFLLYLLPPLAFGMRISEYGRFEQPGLFAELLFIQGLFLAGLIASLRQPARRLALVDAMPAIRGEVVGLALAGLIAAAMAFGVEGENVLGADAPYQAYIRNLENQSGLPEYLIAFSLWPTLLLRGTKWRWVPVLLAGLLAVKLLLLGFRVQILMLALLGYYVTVERRVGPFAILGFMGLGFGFAALLGYLKEGGEGDFIDMVFNASHGFVLSHQTGVLYSSLAILGAAQEGVLTAGDTVTSALGALMNTVVPSGLIKPLLPGFNLASHIQNYYPTPGGVLFPVPFYVWLGAPGPFLLGAAFGRVPSLIAAIAGRVTEGSVFTGTFIATLFVTLPRWVSYDVGNFLFRLPLMVAAGALLLYALARVSLPDGGARELRAPGGAKALPPSGGAIGLPPSGGGAHPAAAPPGSR